MLAKISVIIIADGRLTLTWVIITLLQAHQNSWVSVTQRRRGLMAVIRTLADRCPLPLSGPLPAPRALKRLQRLFKPNFTHEERGVCTSTSQSRLGGQTICGVYAYSCEGVFYAAVSPVEMSCYCQSRAYPAADQNKWSVKHICWRKTQELNGKKSCTMGL